MRILARNLADGDAGSGPSPTCDVGDTSTRGTEVLTTLTCLTSTLIRMGGMIMMTVLAPISMPTRKTTIPKRKLSLSVPLVWRRQPQLPAVRIVNAARALARDVDGVRMLICEKMDDGALNDCGVSVELYNLLIWMNKSMQRLDMVWKSGALCVASA